MINSLSSIDQTICVLSDELNIYYPNKIKFSGNVSIKQDHNIFMSDKLIILLQEKNELLYNTKLYAYGHIEYKNSYVILTGIRAWINFYNKNIDIHEGTYRFLEPPIHGTANSIMQRGEGRYTIVKKGKCTSCISNKNYWNITGSKILYDHKTRNMDIWNACLKIKKIPIFYSPYLSLSLHQNNILGHYIPNIKYSNKNGLILKIPCPIFFSKHCSGNISPCYTSHLGTKLATEIYYSVKPGTGLLILDLIGNNKIYNKNFSNNYHNKYWQLYWKHNGIMNKKWHFHSNYTSATGSDNYIENFNIPTYTHSNNNHINQKILCNYSDKNWSANLAYFGITNTNITMIKNHSNYNKALQLELNSYIDCINNQPFNLKLFSQLTQFIPSNYHYPKTIRIHTEPTLDFSINNHYSYFNSEAKLRITHYRQKNVNHYNRIRNPDHHLNNIVNRIIPQFKINGKMIFKEKTHISKKYKHFLEPKLQYLYVPYRFQENIGIYDTDMIHINHNNLFRDTTYSGLDRILSVNQITGNIAIRCCKNKNELFYASIGQIFDLRQLNFKHIKISKCTQKTPNIMLFSGISHWNINDYWNVNTEMQYDMQHRALSFGTIILEYLGKDNQVLQTHYRHTNEQYLEKILPNIKESIYHNTIAQLGVLACYPLIDNWKISWAHYHNIKTNQLIDQTIGIQYYTPCWGVNISCERKMIDWSKELNRSIYDNKIRFDIRIYNSTSNFKTNPYKMLNIGVFPYQHTF